MRLVHCHSVTLLHGHIVRLLHCAHVTLLHCAHVTLCTLLHCHTVRLVHCHIGGDDGYNADDDANADNNDGDDNDDDDCDGDDYDESSPKESFTSLTDVSVKMFSTGLVPTDGTGGLHHHNHHIALPSEKANYRSTTTSIGERYI